MMDTAIGMGFRGILDPIISLILIGTLKSCIILLSFVGTLVRIFQFTIIDGFVKSPTSALYCIPCPVKLKAAISKDMGYRRCLKTVTSNKENI